MQNSLFNIVSEIRQSRKQLEEQLPQEHEVYENHDLNHALLAAAVDDFDGREDLMPTYSFALKELQEYKELINFKKQHCYEKFVEQLTLLQLRFWRVKERLREGKGLLVTCDEIDIPEEVNDIEKDLYSLNDKFGVALPLELLVETTELGGEISQLNAFLLHEEEKKPSSARKAGGIVALAAAAIIAIFTPLYLRESHTKIESLQTHFQPQKTITMLVEEKEEPSVPEIKPEIEEFRKPKYRFSVPDVWPVPQNSEYKRVYQKRLGILRKYRKDLERHYLALKEYYPELTRLAMLFPDENFLEGNLVAIFICETWGEHCYIRDKERKLIPDVSDYGKICPAEYVKVSSKGAIGLTQLRPQNTYWGIRNLYYRDSQVREMFLAEPFPPKKRFKTALYDFLFNLRAGAVHYYLIDKRHIDHNLSPKERRAQMTRIYCGGLRWKNTINSKFEDRVFFSEVVREDFQRFLDEIGYKGKLYEIMRKKYEQGPVVAQALWQLQPRLVCFKD